MDRSGLLRRIPLFAGLTDEEREAIARQAVVKRLPPGGVLVEEGAEGASAYAVLSGRLKVSSRQDGRPLALYIAGPGDIIGELALLHPAPRSASAVALDPVRVLVLHRRDLLPFLRQHPDAALKMMASLAQRVRHLSATLRVHATQPLPDRLWRVLADLGERFGHDTPQGRLIDIALSQRELAQMVGASRESVNKQLRLWRDAGKLRLDNGYITLAL